MTLAYAETVRVNEEAFNYELRRYNDTVTWLAEILPGSMRTPFEYNFDGSELYASDGSSLKPIFEESIAQARTFDSTRAYELRRRKIEHDEYNCMVAMMKGQLPNTMVVVSDFPEELMQSNEDVGGYNVTRKQTMLRVLTKSPQGKLIMYSQSLDKSDRRSLEAIYEALDQKPEPGELLGQRIHLELSPERQHYLVDELTGVYDRSLARQFGGNWYAGLPGSTENTFDFVREQTDLLSAYLGTANEYTQGKSEYGLAAAMRDRYLGFNDTVRYSLSSYDQFPIVAGVMALEEMQRAAMRARQNGDTFSGCGFSSKSVDGGNGDVALELSGYGNQSNVESEDKYGSLKFKCQNGHENTRPRNKLIPKCKTCGIDVSC